MAINFPHNPNVNDVHTEASLGRSWKWDGTTWLIYSSSTTGIAFGDLSVSQQAASGTGSLSYNGTGIFTYTPPAGGGGGSSTFIGLNDTPGSLTAGKWLKVNTGGTALEWTDAPASNDTNDYVSSASLSGNTLTLGRTGSQSLANITVDLSSLNSVPTNITVVNESTDTECYPLFTTEATGNLAPKTVTSFKLNSSSGQLEAGSFKKTGGTSSEFLKADGSVDSTTYLSSAPSYALNDLSDVDATTGAANGKILKYNGTSWEIADDLSGGGGGGGGNVAVGSVMIWSGSAVSIPSGWQLCDGTNGSPDLRDKFVVGAGSTYAVDATGGSTTDTVTISGSDTVNISGSDTITISGTTGGAQSGGGGYPSSGSNAHQHTFSGSATVNITASDTVNISGSDTVNTVPPYYALCYIYCTSAGSNQTFIGLGDTPSSLTAGKWLKVNAGATALEWTDAPSGSNTTYDLSAVADSGNAKVRLTGSDSTDDDIIFSAGGGITYAVTGNTIQISSANSLGALTDVTISGSPSNGQVLKYNGSAWVNDTDATGGASQNLFSTVAVAGQSNVVADTTTDTLTFSAGSNMIITTDANNDIITFASAGSGSLNIKYLQDTGPANSNYISYFTGVLGSYANYQFDTNYPTGFQSQSWNNWGGWINPWNAGGQQGDGLIFFTLSDNSETTWDLKLHSTSPNSSLTSGNQCRCWTSTDGENWVYQGANNTISTTTTISITTAYLIVTDLGMGSGNEVYLEVGSSSIGGTSYLTKTGLSVNKLANSGTGDLTYNNAGVFTYTPPALTDNNDYVTNLSLSGTTLTAEFSTTSLNQTIDLASINTDTNTQLSTEQVQDIVGGMVDGGTETRIGVTYDDTSGKLNFVVDDQSSDNNTTYDLVTAADSGNAKITLSGSDSTNDDVILSAGGGITYAVTGNTIQISSANSLGELTDVDISSSPSNGEVLKYNGSQWAPAADASGGGADGNDYVTNLSLSGTTLTAEFGNTSLNQTINLASINTDTNTQLSTEAVQDIVGAMFSGNTETNITATYQDSDGTIDLVATGSNTTYDLSATASSGNAKVRLTGSDSTEDDVTLSAGGGISYAVTGNTIQISSVNSLAGLSDVDIGSSPGTNQVLKFNGSQWAPAADATGGAASIPSGSVMLFYQSSAPTGWTKQTSHNNKALRVVSGNGGGSGGSVGFTSAFANHTVSISGSDTVTISDSDTVSISGSDSVSISGTCTGTQTVYWNTTQAFLTVDQMPSHQHEYDVPRGTTGASYGFQDTATGTSSGLQKVASTGGSNYHTHAIIMQYVNGNNFSFSGSDNVSISGSDTVNISGSDTVNISGSDTVNTAVQYVDVIICSKN